MSTRYRAICWIWLACWSVTAPAMGQDGSIHFPDGTEPVVLSEIVEPGEVLAIAFSPDGQWAAVASPSETRKSETRIQLYRAGGGRTDEITVTGAIRALLHVPDGSGFYGLLHRAGRRQPGETYLVQIESGRPKARRLRLVASNSVGIEHWAAGNSLLILTDDEIRSVLLDGLRSGPLFRVPGGNLSIASLAGSDIVVVGQSDGLLLLRLDDRPGEEQMPIRESVALSSPVRGLAAAADGRSALARLEDGRIVGVRFDPLRVEERGTAAFVASLGRANVREPIEIAPRIDLEPPPATVAEPAVTRPPEPAPVPLDADVELPAQVEREPTRPIPSKQEPPAAEPPSRVPTRGAPPQLSGRLTGPAASDVQEIVLFGPSNLLREAARTRPDPEGGWLLDGLAPGRYRIQLDGGGNRVLISEPSFVLVEIPSTGSIQAPDFRVLRSYRP